MTLTEAFRSSVETGAATGSEAGAGDSARSSANTGEMTLEARLIDAAVGVAGVGDIAPDVLRAADSVVSGTAYMES